jgi:hypothetical protein
MKKTKMEKIQEIVISWEFDNIEDNKAIKKIKDILK